MRVRSVVLVVSLALGSLVFLPRIAAAIWVDVNTGLTVTEGEAEAIGPGNLRIGGENPEDINFHVVRAPSAGMLTVGGVPATVFTQENIDWGMVGYQHHGSEGPDDFFIFTAISTVLDDTLGNEIFDITVSPADDVPYLSRYASLEVCYPCGEALITSFHLLVEDPDTPAQDIQYVVIDRPYYGDILRLGSIASVFTQQDVDRGYITYRHDGGHQQEDEIGILVNGHDPVPGPGILFEISINGAPVSSTPAVPGLDRPHIVSQAPNPFNPVTSLRIKLPRDENIEVEVFDAGGHLVDRVASGRYPAGVHEFSWNGTDATGRTVASGLYFFRLSGDRFLETRKTLLVK